MNPSELHAPRSIGPDSNGILMTADEFRRIESWENGWRYELIHGVLIVNPRLVPASAAPTMSWATGYYPSTKTIRTAQRSMTR